MANVVRIGELARRAGVNPKTIRYYEAIGLLPEPQRTAAGYRLYGDDGLARLAFIRKAKALGLSLSQIAEVLAIQGNGQPPCEHVASLLDQKIAAIDAQMQALAEFRAELVHLRQQADESVACDPCICPIIEHQAPSHEAPAALSRVWQRG